LNKKWRKQVIEKIIEIKNVGHFTDYRINSSYGWNGDFKKVNIIYAPNGSGKTTLSTILKSLANNDVDLIKRKQTFGTQNAESIKLKESGNIINFDGTKWTDKVEEIEVFDINYIEEYLFSGSFVRKQNKTNLYKLLLGEQGDILKNQLKSYRRKVITLNGQIKKCKRKGDIAQKLLKEQELQIAEQELSDKETEFKAIYEPIFNDHITIINKYLSHFSNYIKLKEFKWDKSSSTDIFRLLPVFNVYTEEVTFTNVVPGKKEKTASYSLSEGDKSTIALCFFLGRLELNSNTNRIVIFDDPLSSFDYARRNSTIFQLARIANESQQFFLLSHDLHFIYDFTKKVSFLDTLNIRIENNGVTSILIKHNLIDEYLTGTNKDLNELFEYKKNPNVSDERRRDIIRCLRPILEGIIKTKYYGIIRNDIWLGDIIEYIKTNKNNPQIKCLSDNIYDLMEINDYCHTYSHGTNTDTPQVIEPNELLNVVNLLLELRVKL